MGMRVGMEDSAFHSFIHSLGIIQSILTRYAMIIAGWDVFQDGQDEYKISSFWNLQIFNSKTDRTSFSVLSDNNYYCFVSQSLFLRLRLRSIAHYITTRWHKKLMKIHGKLNFSKLWACLIRKIRKFISIMKKCSKAWCNSSLRVSWWTSLVKNNRHEILELRQLYF